MEIHPEMDIRFPEAKERALIDAMKARSSTPWSWQAHDPQHRKPREGTYYFHRDQVDGDVACTLCIERKSPGHLSAWNIVPDEEGWIEVDRYVVILREFDAAIAEPAAEALGGMTSIDTSRRTLEDYFSPEAVHLLEVFCGAPGSGSHPLDQDKWREFLICVHRSKADVHCDVFGKCLEAKDWWPEKGISRLVHEYDFAMLLLGDYDKPR